MLGQDLLAAAMDVADRGADIGVGVAIERLRQKIDQPAFALQKAERLAKRLGVSRSELYQQAIAAMLERYDAKAITDSYNVVIAREPNAFKLDPAIERAQFENLPDDEW